MRSVPAVVLLGMLVAAAGCTSGSPVSPSPPPLNLSGTWSGAMFVDLARARMTWTLTQNDTTVTGPVLVLLMNGTVLLNGTLSGTLIDSTLDYRIAVAPDGIPTQPACSGELVGTATPTATGASTLGVAFNLLSTNCAPPVPNGSFTLTKH